MTHYSTSYNSLTIAYGVDEQRIKSVQKGSRNMTRYYMGNYEEEIYDGHVRKINYICGGNGLAAVYIQHNGKDTIYYAETDYQGSLIALFSANGTVVERYAYDPWGNRRDPSNWNLANTRTSFLLNRGYTMHEHLDVFHLINMNGRVYDPLTAQFLSPDPFLQAPGDWLNYNRYTYCLNNPMKYTDPTGEVFGIDDVIIIAAMAYFGGMQANFSYSTQHGNNPFNPGNWNWESAHTYIGIGSGAMGGAGMAGHAIPYTQVPGMLANGGLQAGIQVGLNGIGNLTENRPFFENWYWSAGMGFLSGAMAGYDLAKEKNTNYWWGSKVKPGRTQWSFFTSELPETSVYFNGIRFTTSSAENTCVVQSLVELETARGGTRTEIDFKTSTKWTEKDGVLGVNDPKSYSELLKNQGFDNKAIGGSIGNQEAMQILSDKNGNIIIVHKGNGGYHMTTVKQIDYYQSGKIIIHGRGRTYNLNKFFAPKYNYNPYIYSIF